MGISRAALAKRSSCAARATSPTSPPTRPSSQEFIARKNAPRRAVLAIELASPCCRCRRHRTTDFSTATVTVTRSATISVRTVLYTVPSRLIGCRLKVHVYDDRLVCYLGTTPVLTVGRRHFKRHGPRVRVVDYRHLIGTPGQEAAGLPSLGVPRRAVPAPGLPPRLGGAGRRARAAQGLPRLCRPVASRRDARLRGSARRSPRTPCSTPAALPISKRRARRWHRSGRRRARQQCRCRPPTSPATTSC